MSRLQLTLAEPKSEADYPRRITIGIEDDMHRALRMAAADQGRRITDVVRAVLAEWANLKEARG
jgi:hypothetical protein